MLRSLVPSILLLCHPRAPLARAILLHRHPSAPSGRGRAPGTGRISLQGTAGTQVTTHVKVETVQPACACRQPLPGVRLYFSAARDLSGKSCIALSAASVAIMTRLITDAPINNRTSLLQPSLAKDKSNHP